MKNNMALSQRMKLFITAAARTSNLVYSESMFFPEGNTVSQLCITTDWIKVLALALSKWELEPK
jgi:hypothetical protein